MRVNNWAIALQSQITQFNEKQFAWGSHDCFTFAADCVKAITGVDKMSKHRGGYKTELGANKKLKRMGGVEKAITSELGEPISHKLAQRGDVVYFVSPMGDTAGICMGRVIAAPAANGVLYIPMTAAKAAWRV